MNTPNPRTSVVLGAALLAIVSLVALQQVSVLRGQVAQTYNRLEQGESVTLPADTNNIVTCAADGNFAITDDATSAAVRFWMYEYTGNETPTYTDGAYFLSAKEKELNPNDASLSTLTEWTAGKTYYVMTEEDVAFTCGEGIRMQQSTANIFLTGGYSVYSGTGFKLPLVGGESNLIMPLIIESTGGRVDILQLQFDVQGGTGSLELIAPNTVSLGGDVIVNNTLTATKDKCPEGSPPTLYCTSFGTTDSLMDIEQLTINFNAFMKTDVEGAVSGEVISVRLSNVIAQDNEGKLLRMNNGNATMEGEIFFGRTAADGAGANADVQVEGTVILTSPFIMPPFTPEYGDARDWEYPLSEDPLIGPIPTGSAAIIGRIFIGNTDNTNVLNGKNKIQMKQYAFTIMHKNINIDSYAIRLKNSTITAPCETVDKKPFNEIEPDSLDIFIYEEISCSFEGLDAIVLPAEGKVYELLADISLSDTDVASYPTFLTTMNAARYFVFRQNKPAITWVDMDDERQYTHMNIINAQRTIGSEMAMFRGYVICGDGIIADTETCDDGNTDAFDGCSDSCAVEPAWQCAGEPSECSVFIPTLGGSGSSMSSSGVIAAPDGRLDVVVQSIGAADTVVANQTDVPLFRFKMTAGEEKDIRLTSAVFEANSGSLLNGQNYTLWMDTTGDLIAETIIQSDVSAAGDLVTFNDLVDGGVVIEAEETLIFEVHADIAASFVSDDLSIAFASNGASGSYLGAEQYDDGSDLMLETGIAVYPAVSKNFVLISQGNLYVSKDSMPIRSRQLLGGTLGDSVLRVQLQAQYEDIDVTDLQISSSGSVAASVDRLELFRDADTTPFATATVGGCGADDVPTTNPTSGEQIVTFCANMANGQLVIPEGVSIDVVVRPRLKNDDIGAIAGETLSFWLSARAIANNATGEGAVRARGVASSNNLLANNGDDAKAGEIFIRSDGIFGTDNQTIVGTRHQVVLAKITSIANAAAMPDGTALVTGVQPIGRFTFTAATNNNTSNGVNKATLSGVIFTITTSNVDVDSGSFAFYNAADPAVKSACSLLSGASGSGSMMVACANMTATSVDTQLDAGESSVFVLEADVRQSTADYLLQVSLQDFTSIDAAAFGPSASHIHWLDDDAGTDTSFYWIEYDTIVVRSTRYEGLSPVSPPACSDGVDNDLDGKTDFVPADCSARQQRFDTGALCPGISQICGAFSDVDLEVDYTAPVSMTFEIYAEEYEEIYCAPQRVNVYVDGVKRATTAFVGRIPVSGTNTSDFVLSSTVDLGTFPAGTHTLRLQGESMVGGCNTGDLIGWGGHFTLDIGCDDGDPQCSSALDTTE